MDVGRGNVEMSMPSLSPPIAKLISAENRGDPNAISDSLNEINVLLETSK